jgi:cytochrome b subunit of formate dehydrogenase
MSDSVVRFSPRQRIEHLLVMALFLVLAVTGLPQKFPDGAWARAAVDLMGGIARVRWLHRAAGVLFTGLAVVHLSVAVVLAVTRRVPLSVVPTRKDFRDAIMNLRYYLRLADVRPRFDRFDYREKFEYWGLVMGALIMSATGLILFFPILVARYLPGELIPVSKVAHSNEGLMAFLVVVTWHVYNAHLAPGVFPFNPTIFTGRISREHLRHEHPLEYERLFPERGPSPPGPEAVVAAISEPPPSPRPDRAHPDG